MHHDFQVQRRCWSKLREEVGGGRQWNCQCTLSCFLKMNKNQRKTNPSNQTARITLLRKRAHVPSLCLAIFVYGLVITAFVLVGTLKGTAIGWIIKRIRESIKSDRNRSICCRSSFLNNNGWSINTIVGNICRRLFRSCNLTSVHR